MGQRIEKRRSIRVELTTESYKSFEEWADLESPSVRFHAAKILRKVTSLRRTHPAMLVELGLADPVLGMTRGTK